MATSEASRRIIAEHQPGILDAGKTPVKAHPEQLKRGKETKEPGSITESQSLNILPELTESD